MVFKICFGIFLLLKHKKKALKNQKSWCEFLIFLTQVWIPPEQIVLPHLRSAFARLAETASVKQASLIIVFICDAFLTFNMLHWLKLSKYSFFFLLVFIIYNCMWKKFCLTQYNGEVCEHSYLCRSLILKTLITWILLHR